MEKFFHSKGIHRLILWFCLDLLISIALLLLISISDSDGLFARSSLPRLILIAGLTVGLAGLFMLSRWVRTKKLEERISSVCAHPSAQFVPLVLISAFAGGLYLLPGQSLAYNLLPLLLCAWLMGIQAHLFFQAKKTQTNPDQSNTRQGKILVVISLACIYLFLALPARLPSVLDGVPWDTPLEFLVTTTIIPLGVLINWRTFSKKPVVAISLVLVLLRLATMLSLPESGLMIRSYQNQADLQSDTWHKTYSTFWTGASSDIMKAHYNNLYEFPLDWLTRQNLVSTPRPWVGITVNGYGKLEPGETLVFETRGLLDGQITLKDTLSGQSVGATILNAPAVDTAKDLSPASGPSNFSISGQLIFKDAKDYQLAAYILKPDHTLTSAFENRSVWTSTSIFNVSAAKITLVSWAAWLQNLGMLALLLACLILTAGASLQRDPTLHLGFFLGVSGIYFLLMISKLSGAISQALAGLKVEEILPLFVVAVLLINNLVILKDRYGRKNSPNAARVFLFSSGLIVLAYFLMIYAGSLKQFTVFSTLDDAYEYQYFARKIFVNRDFLLLETPPRAYKVLFPYLVGLLHLFFGQSSNAQFFLNNWCAILTGMFLIKIIRHSYPMFPFLSAAGGLFLLPLFGNYFYLYFQFGLIEPLAGLFLFAFFYFALKKATARMLAAGTITVLLRMDYAGAVLSGLLLTGEPIYGSLIAALRTVLAQLKDRWRTLGIQSIILITPTIVIIGVYQLLTTNYMLNASDTAHTNLVSILEGFSRVLLGGNLTEISTLFLDKPVFTIFTLIILVGGAFLALAAGLLRSGLFHQLDFRLSLIFAGLLSIYLVVHPTGYPPRFSTPLLPLSIWILSAYFNQIWKTRRHLPEGEL